MRPKDAFLRLVLGPGQIGLAAATIVAWLLGAPLLVVLLLALATGGLVVFSLSRWRGR